MASSSSSSNMALPRANDSKYDVFLSFRGEDTRNSFTDHLYNALKQAGILTFRDSDDAERGEELKEEIEKAIKASDASIIVLSENYATSTWCLDELSLILDQRRDCNHFVLPVFYNVDPSNVGKQKGSFEIQADPSKRRWTDDNVKRWKAALTEVVGVIGMTLVGSETKFIREVVDTIYNRLDRKQIHIPANITGMDARYEEIISLLRQSEAQFLVICGMAGSGKSTMAQYIVYSEGQEFESNSIVEKIGSRCKNSHEMVVLQEQLCSDISKGKQERRIDTVCKGTAHIELLLEKTKTLIVLDEIVEERHLEELLGSGNINKESKIIITTNNDISNWFMSKSLTFQKYIMRLLNDDEALELLSLHAFRSKLPKDGYTELAQQVVQYCGGNPLALEVLGSSLSRNDTITSWKSELSSFEKSFDDRMYEVFIRSYNSLPSFSEKELFLHIACFFVGSDMNYVVKILEPDYGAESKIKTLTSRCFLYVTPDNKLMMHRLLQEMGRSLVDRESRIISERTRVWRNKDSYEILSRKKRSNTIEGLALDIQTLIKEDGFESRHLRELSTDSLQHMDQLKLLQLKFVKLTGSYKDLSEHLRWLYWVGFIESTVPTDIYMGNMVALDMSYSYLKEFEPPMYLPSLKILNLKDSLELSEIRNFDEIPNLETLILWNCHNLLCVCRTIGNLKKLALLNMAGCKNLFNRVPISTSGVESALELSFPLPCSLQRAFLNDCSLECTDYFPLSFSDQSFLQYINLANGHFEILPSYNLLKNLRVLDLRKCSRLKRLLCLPSTLAELYIYDCKSIEKITFESGWFTLQEFGYEGCVILSEVEGWFKLLLITKLDESDLGHMIWLKEYQYQEVYLVGDYELTNGRSCHLQMLYEFNIMSTSLPDIKHPKLTTEYTSRSTSLSFDVPLCPRRCRIKGLNVTFRYTISGDDWVWFVKIRTTNNVDLMYHPKVFGKPGSGNIGRWLSYWPIGNLLDVGDVVYVSIVVLSGLEVLECGASLVYTNDDVACDTMEYETGWVEAFIEDLYRFKLRNGSYYLCQRDIYKLTQVGRFTPGWLSILAGYTIDDAEVRGWRMTGRPQQSYQSFIELKTIRCIIHGPNTVNEVDDVMSIVNEPVDANLVKLPIVVANSVSLPIVEKNHSKGKQIVYKLEYIPLATNSIIGKRPEMEDAVSLPIVEKNHSKGKQIVYKLEYIPLWGTNSIIGKRPEMEDAVAVVPRFMEVPIKMFVGDHVKDGVNSSLTNLTTHFFGVYDGHGGSQVANYCSERVHVALEEELKVYAQETINDSLQVQWEKVFTNCFQKVDDEVGGRISRQTLEAKGDTFNVTSEPVAPEIVGSTAVVAVINSSHIILANCGDSRAVLYRGKEAVALSNNHKPNREDELARIEAADGKVIQWNGHRVFGVLAMSRSIGDRYLKPWIIPDPEVTFTARAREDECLVLASDGLWDVMSNEEVCEVARKRILIWHKKNGGNITDKGNGNGVDNAAQAAADYLVMLALQKGSKGNISVIVVDLKAQRKFKQLKLGL